MPITEDINNITYKKKVINTYLQQVELFLGFAPFFLDGNHHL